jgi:hypothetical protein
MPASETSSRRKSESLFVDNLKPFSTASTRSGKAVVLLQGGTEPDPVLKDVPFILDLARNEEERQTIRLLYAGQGFGRPFLAPPDLPSGRVRMLRDAFNATMKDSEFIEDARRQKLALEPKDGETLAELAKIIYSTPMAIVERVTNLIR